MSSRLVINADDFGLSKGTNKGIKEAHNKGILTSASIFANGPAFIDALSILEKCPRLGVGAHLTLTIGKSILPPKDIPLLVEPDGYFKNTFLNLLVKATFSRQLREQVKKEWQAQINYLRKHKIKIDHLNAQEHVHMIPSLFGIIMKLAQSNNIKVVRVSSDCMPFSKSFLIKNRPPFINILKFAILKCFSMFTRTPLTTSFVGILYTQQMNKGVILEALKNLANTDKDVEVLLHPGYFEIDRLKFNYKKQHIYKFMKHKNRRMELDTLVDKEVIEAASKFTLLRFQDL